MLINTCQNDEPVIVNGTLVVETRFAQDARGGVTFSERSWLAGVTAQSESTSYTVARMSFDGFKTKVRKGLTTLRSRTTSWLQLTPATGAGGR